MSYPAPSSEAHQPLLEPDIDDAPSSRPTGPTSSAFPGLPPPVTASSSQPTSFGSAGGTGRGGGMREIFKQSSHPVALLFLFLFRTAAIVTYLLCGFFTSNYVLSTVLVVVLLALDFWTVRNVSGRVLVGLRYWNMVDERGESVWVFEGRDPSHPANPLDAKFFWTALYSFPFLWALLLIVSLLKFNISFLPIVALALLFNLTNAAGFSFAERDARRRFAAQGGQGFFGGLGGGLGGLASSTVLGGGGIGGRIVGGLMRMGGR